MAFTGLKRSLGGLWDVRRDELPRLVPLGLAYGLVMASLYVLKPARNALFLSRVGIEQLPYALLLVALIGGLAATAFSRVAARLRLDRLILGTFLFLTACLGGFWLLLPHEWTWSYYLFYVWVNLFSLMAPSLLWLLANAIFDAREARRLFGVVNTIGIVGVVLGSALAGAIVKSVGTVNLLLVCIALLVVCLGLLPRLGGGEARPRRRRENPAGTLSLIAGSRLLRLLAGMAALAAAVAAVVDVQFNQIVDQSFPTSEEKTAFFGQFFASLNLLVFLFQLVVAPRILRSLGVTSALVFLPLSMAMGSLAVLLVPGLVAGILVKIGDGGFRHSIHKSAAEILFLPIPAEVKQRTKVLLDTTVDNLATGLGAVLVLLLIGAGVAYHQLSLLSLGLIALWLGFMVRTRGAYVDAFRQALERREIDAGEFTVDITEAAVLNSLVDSLESDSERRVIYALDMLSEVRARRLVEPVHGLLSHASAEVRRRALCILRNQDGQVPREDVEEALGGADLSVRVEALFYLCSKGADDRLTCMRQALASPDRRTRTAAVGCIAQYGTPEENELIDEAFIDDLVGSSGEEGKEERVLAAGIVGTLSNPGLRPYLRELIRQLMEDPEPEVVRRTIASLGQLADLEYLPWLLEELGDRRHRLAAREALAAYGPAAFETLAQHLLDDRNDLVVRRNIPRVLSAVLHQGAVDLLTDAYERVDPRLQYPVIKALSKLRGQSSELRFGRAWTDGVLQEQMRSYYECIRASQALEPLDRDACGRLLARALQEKQDQSVERIFRLLGLQYAPRDMYHAYLGFVSGQPATRASALEFLDNVLEREVKLALLPLLDPSDVHSALPDLERRFGPPIRGREQALRHLLDGRDAWLRACAVYSVRPTAAGAEIDLARLAQDDPHPLVRETADLVVRQADA